MHNTAWVAYEEGLTERLRSYRARVSNDIVTQFHSGELSATEHSLTVPRSCLCEDEERRVAGLVVAQRDQEPLVLQVAAQRLLAQPTGERIGLWALADQDEAGPGDLRAADAQLRRRDADRRRRRWWWRRGGRRQLPYAWPSLV
jgi:hypothetical protein